MEAGERCSAVLDADSQLATESLVWGLMAGATKASRPWSGISGRAAGGSMPVGIDTV